ncbi:hypothetical protein KM043_018409 [Ampulex compressa]|nr:hypothetical protein KM043_018409 [Ampulex compressa]
MQIFVIQQIVFCLTVDFLIATLFWYPAARLEMIMIDLERATTKRQLRNCVKDHQEVTHGCMCRTNFESTSCLVSI